MKFFPKSLNFQITKIRSGYAGVGGTSRAIYVGDVVCEGDFVLDKDSTSLTAQVALSREEIDKITSIIDEAAARVSKKIVEENIVEVLNKR